MPYIPDRKGTTSVQTAKTSSARLNSTSGVGAVKTTTAQGQYSQTASNVEQVNLDTTFSTEKSTSTSVNYPTYNGETTLVGVGLDENGNTVVVDANYGQTPPPAPTFYQEVKQGDTLSQIARDNDVSLEELLEANPELKDHPDEINVGDKVKIPTATQNNSSQTNAGTSSASQTQMSGTTSSSSNQTNVGGTGTGSGTSSQADLKGYTVQSGDTLSQIARDNGISVEELAKFNNIEDPNYIEVGQYIQIPSSTETVDLSPFMTNYEVKRGDTLSQIAREYGIDYHYLAEINHINDPNYIEVGQKIIIPNKEAINQFLKEKLDTAIEHIQNGDSITDILADILNTQELVSNSNADNNEELISDITKKYQQIIHEALENGTLQEATTTLIGTITTVISAMKKSAQQKKNLETMMQLWDELFPKVADAIPTEEEVAQQMQQIWEQHFGQDTQQEEITSQEALDMAQQLWNEHFGEATVPEGEATIDEKEDIETETQTDPNAEFPNETAPPETLDQIEDKENVDTTPETETTETEIQTEPITETSETEPVSESEETETEAIPNIPFPAFPSIDEENQMSESEAIDQMQQMWTEQFGETPVPETEAIQDEVDNTQNITIEEDGNQSVTYDVDDQTTTNAEDIIEQNRQALENMDEELEAREDEIEGQHEISEDEVLNQILEDIDNNDTTPETELITEASETEPEVTIVEPETEVQTEPITETPETETEVTIPETETEVQTEPISESAETETERPIIEPLYEPETEAISPYQDLMDAIPPSEDKEIDFSEIIPGSPVALAIEKYKDELINAKYAVVTKDIFIAVTEDTIDGSPHYVSHVVINDPSQIQGLLANGSYRSGMETPTSAATRADTRLLINGSHFDQDTMDGRQDLRPVINGNVNYNRMTIFDGKVMEGDAAGSMEICLDKDGRFFTPNMGTSSQQLVNDGVKFSFSSQDCHLINNGNYNVDGQDGPKESSVIGMKEPGEYYILTGESTNVGEADYLWNKGCTFAKSMDQGGSVALVMKINGEQKLIRTSTFPHTGQEGERAVGDFLAFF